MRGRYGGGTAAWFHAWWCGARLLSCLGRRSLASIGFAFHAGGSSPPARLRSKPPPAHDPACPYRLPVLQDPFDEDDWEAYTAFTAKGLCQVVGDDLLCTNPVRVQKAIDTKACNALLLKVRAARVGAAVWRRRCLRLRLRLCL